MRTSEVNFGLRVWVERRKEGKAEKSLEEF